MKNYFATEHERQLKRAYDDGLTRGRMESRNVQPVDPIRSSETAEQMDATTLTLGTASRSPYTVEYHNCLL